MVYSKVLARPNLTALVAGGKVTGAWPERPVQLGVDLSENRFTAKGMSRAGVR